MKKSDLYLLEKERKKRGKGEREEENRIEQLAYKSLL